MKKLIAIAGLVVSSSLLNAQAPKGFFEGYVVMNSNDTIQGYIKYKNKEEVLDKVTVIIDAENKKTIKASEIKFFSADEEFISYKLSGEFVFMKVLTQGYYSLYEYQLPPEKGSKYQLYYQKENGKLQMISISNWKKQVEDLISDNEQLVNDLKKKKYSLETLESLFDTYNADKE